MDKKTVSRLIGRASRYGAVGLVSTIISSLAFFVVLRLSDYTLGNVAAWAAGLVTGFTLNRRFTFGFRGAPGRTRQALLYFVGTVLQLGLAQACLYVFIARMRTSSALAWGAALVVTTLFGFVFASLVTFRHRAKATQ